MLCKKISYPILSIVCSLLLSSCTAPTAYQPKGLTGGYSEDKIDKDVWQIKAEGNIYTSPNRIRNMLMLRAAELTIKNGYQKYAVVGGDGIRNQILTIETPASFSTSGNSDTSFIGHSATTTINTNTTYKPPSTWNSKPMPEGSIIIKMFKENDKAPKASISAQNEIERLKQLLVN